ncbi:hypothetical protein ACFYWY_11195 [Streptomyces sp. NPDC002870]
MKEKADEYFDQLGGGRRVQEFLLAVFTRACEAIANLAMVGAKMQSPVG